MHWVHLVSENFLKRRCARQSRLRLQLLMTVLSHLGLYVSEVLILRVVSFHPPTVLHSLHGTRVLLLLRIAAMCSVDLS